MSTGMDNDDLHDARLRRALDHAPDRDAMPAAHTREAILKMAHNLATASAPAAGPAVEAAPWWRRLFGGGSPRSRMPWNAAFATVLVATFVTVLWHREPVPEARLDGEAQVAGAPAPASAPPAQSAEAPAVAAAPAPAPVPPAPAAEPAATADTTPPAAQRSEAARDAKETLKQRETQDTREASRRREAPAAAASVQKDEARAMEKAAPAAPVVQAPAPVPAPAAPAIASAPMPAAPPMADVGQSPMPYAAAPPAPAVAPAAPAAPAPMQRESADTASSLAAQGGASANVAGMQRRAAPAPASAAAKAVAAGGFTALDRWTALDITRAGTTTRQARGDTEGLAALVNTVARAATMSGGEWGAPVEARIELRRDGALLAVLEIAGDQVRWTPQPGGPAFLGTPPAQALEALRTALSRTR
ncbi:hypothetical protein [Variovorax boronicumulans]|uniref:hypothetical protein n=1 Tax=Variovorax boronicumulans TaxID=436515 RepID=UPI0012E661E9|nr:hypothetical protein [Variovorax boronicumulans]GER14418.1 hypothetical protein VHAB30_56120 [Variovorax boronicumulans]